LINSEYWEALGIVPIILAAYYFNGVFTNITSAFYITKNTKYLPMAVGTAAIFNIISNIIFIPIFGYIAAAYNTLFAYLISAAILYKFQKKIYEVEYEWGRVFKILLSTLLIFIADYILSNTFNGNTQIVSKIVLLFSHILLLKILGFYTRNEINEMKNMLKR
jgi:O-antigen/teichoic acid export membrane protein